MFNLWDYIIYEHIYEHIYGNNRINTYKGYTAASLIMKDMGAISLRKYINDYSVDLPQFIEIAVQLAETLRQLHKHGIIHGDLNPDNILIHASGEKAYIIDFNSAISFSQENNNAFKFGRLTGTIEYISPEQTGRVNIGVDQRSDLYSLGVIFYEIITCRLPLQAENPAQLIYAHITQKPRPPIEINPDIPPVISDIIMKLLEKAVGDRYQSAGGLLQDLEECRKQLKQTGKVKPFPIGKADASASSKLPSNLCGRQKERESLKAAFDRVCEGHAGAVLVSGYPGTGKTMLIIECLRPLALKKGYFIMGKFHQAIQNIPYAPLAAAFGNLIKQLMTKSREELNSWKKRILRALHHNGAVVTKIIPELEYIIGKQPPVDALPPKEAENRFHMVFGDFIKVFARKNHPLVLFLDDLQWIDPASMRLLEYLIRNPALHYFLFASAFRANEIDDNHPLADILEEFHGDQPDKIHIALMPLKRHHAEELVAKDLHTESMDYLNCSLDMHLIEKAVEIISDQTDMDNLLKSVLDIAAQSIGASKGCLILEKSGELFIEVIKDGGSRDPVIKSIPLKESKMVSKAVVRYTARTLETIVINCKEHTGIFAGDPYMAKSGPKSIACLPLLFQGIPFGVLYFENSFIPGVFAPERLNLLKLLSAHIACIKKLQLYAERDTVKPDKEALPSLIDPLTERETDVLHLIAEGMSNKEIAHRLEITINTVKGHIKNIYEKLGVNRRVQAITKARELKIMKKS